MENVFKFHDLSGAEGAWGRERSTAGRGKSWTDWMFEGRGGWGRHRREMSVDGTRAAAQPRPCKHPKHTEIYIPNTQNIGELQTSGCGSLWAALGAAEESGLAMGTCSGQGEIISPWQLRHLPFPVPLWPPQSCEGNEGLSSRPVL